MAPRSRRNSFRRRRSRVAADWVYRPNVFDDTGALIDDLGTYDPTPGTLVAGATTANFHVLYDSHNRFSAMQMAGAFVSSGLPNAARAEAHRPLIMRVQGYLLYTPTTWALGSTIVLALRFGIFEQDPAAGSVLVDAAFRINNLPAAAAISQLRPATWANDRNWQHEARIMKGFSDNERVFQRWFNFRVNRRIDPNECYGVWMESQNTGLFGSANIQYQWWMRTLVADES